MKQFFFPLNTVLFPGGILPLQIFEQRYLKLVSDCMKNGHGFVVVLINKGREVADRPEIFQVGTYAEIVDWESLTNGILGIKVKGLNTVHIHDTSAKDNGLIVGHTEAVAEPAGIDAPIGNEYSNLVETLQQLAQHPFVTQRYPDINYSSAIDVCYRLGELLPVSNITRQDLLETRETKLLLSKIQSIINKLAS